MATDFPIPAPGKVSGIAVPAVPLRPAAALRIATGMLLPVLLDAFCIALASIAGILFHHLGRRLDAGGVLSLGWKLDLEYGPAFFFLAQAHQLYARSATLLQVSETARMLKVSSYGLLLLVLGAYFTHANMPRLLLVHFWSVSTVLLITQRHTTGRLIRQFCATACNRRNVLIYGANRETRRLFSYLLHSPHLGLIPIGFLEEDSAHRPRLIYSHDYHLRHHVPVITEPLSESLLLSLDIKEIFAAHNLSSTRMHELLGLADSTGIKVNFVGAGQPYCAERSTTTQLVDGLMVVSFDIESETRRVYVGCKRATDVLLSLFLILLTLPLWVFCAAMVKATSRGPVFFRQQRTGQGGRPFIMLKFRSMYVDTPSYGRSPESSRDARITPAGRLLRKTSFDELPQLLNVLKGDMSLVGPRPEMPYVTDTYNALERRRLAVPQGLTGLWQLSGDRRFIIHQAIEYDLYYIENRSLFLDLAIMVHTLVFAMKGV